MSNDNINQIEPEEEEYAEEVGLLLEGGNQLEIEVVDTDAAAEAYDNDNEAPQYEYNYNVDAAGTDYGINDQPQIEDNTVYNYRYSNGEGTEQGNYYDQEQYYYDEYGNAYYYDNDGEVRRYSYGNEASTENGDYWYNGDNWPDYLAENDNDFGEDEDLEVPSGDLEDDDTIANRTPGASSKTSRPSPDKSSKEKSSSSKKRDKKDTKVELGKRSFRWFQRKILAQQIPDSEENLRRKRLLEKCQMVRKVSKPVVTILGAKSKVVRSADSGKPIDPPGETKKGSKQSVGEEQGDKNEESEEDDEAENEQEEDTERSRTFRDYTEREWAVKNTVDFLTKEGCTSSSSRSYRSPLQQAREDADFRLTLYEKQLQKRRKAIGNEQGAPEITAALRRHAERAVWRAVIDNTKPRYPLPRFILPRHRYLKKVQAQFIGPGSYEVDVFESLTKKRQMNLPSTWATCTARFPKDKGEDDGKGGKGGKGSQGGTVLLDPWEALDKANLKYKYPGTYIPFESTPKNFRKGMMESGSRVPPNAYNIKSPLEQYIKKITSIRGPYDCYTPSRGVIPYGYHKSQNNEEEGRLGPGSYEIRTSLVKEMNDSYNFFKGTFGKAERRKMFGFKAAFDNPLWPKEDETMPAVGQYEPDTGTIGQDKEQNLAPFKIQAGLKKRDVKKPDLVAPDYYYFGTGSTWTVPPRGANLASVFHSKTPQILPSKMHQVRKERNKSTNRKLDLEGMGQGYLPETHSACDMPTVNTYVLEDCKDPCLMPKGGPRIDPYAIPGYGVVGMGGEGCCGGGGGQVLRGKANCCGC